MPNLSLIVCLHNEANLLVRLVDATQGLYDDLVVVHDGPVDTDEIRQIVEKKGGHFFVRTRSFGQESHWPFAFEQAAWDWILKLDADEYPSEALRDWLIYFRNSAEPSSDCSGFTCIWPLWNGHRAVTQRYPTGRQFLFHRQRVRYIGIVEQILIADGRWDEVPVVLHHQPNRKSYGLANILVRSQAFIWRKTIAQALQDAPTMRPCWRWTDPRWPLGWEQIRSRPLWTACKRLIKYPLTILWEMIRHREWPRPGFCLMPGIHHALICWEYRRIKKIKYKHGTR